jgi:hypothetical protein
VSADRRVRLWGMVAAHAGSRPVAVEHVCAAAMDVTATDGAGVAVVLAASPRETLYSSSRVAAEVEELSLTFGEGPCVDALHGALTLAPDLRSGQSLARWPVFAPAAVRTGVHAVFALPLQVGAIRLGVLDLYRTEPGELDRERLLDALMLADTACAVLLDSTGQDVLGRPPEPVGLQHPEVHQATGMVSVQLGVTAALALTWLRAHAYAHERRLRDVAHDVVARRLRFHPDDAAHDSRSDDD